MLSEMGFMAGKGFPVAKCESEQTSGVRCPFTFLWENSHYVQKMNGDAASKIHSYAIEQLTEQ